VPVHAIKACSGSRGIAELVLNLGVSWKRAVSFTARLLYLGDKKLLYLLNRRLGGPESQSAHCRKDKFSSLCQKYNSRSSSPYCHMTITCLPYVCNLTVINCTSILHVCCSLNTSHVFQNFLTCAVSNQPLTREFCFESYVGVWWANCCRDSFPPPEELAFSCKYDSKSSPNSQFIHLPLML